MVLTDGQGNVKKWGIVEYGVATWQDPSTWTTYDNRQYTVNNFTGLNHSSVCPKCTEIVDFGVAYPGDNTKDEDTDLDLIAGISFATECKNRCTKHPDCIFWTLTISKKECRLKSKKRFSQKHADKISGTQSCYDYSS